MAESLDPKWPRLLIAARSWRANLIPNTSSSTHGPAQELLRAIEAFEVCEHPREKRAFRSDGHQECGACGTVLVEDAGDDS